MRYLLVLLLTGCAFSPDDLRERGVRTEFTTKLAPREAALCLARSAESYRPMGQFGAAYTSTIREAPKGYEMLVPHPMGGMGYLLLMEITPASSGSSIVALQAESPADMTDEVAERCQTTRLTAPRDVRPYPATSR